MQVPGGPEWGWQSRNSQGKPYFFFVLSEKVAVNLEVDSQSSPRAGMRLFSGSDISTNVFEMLKEWG